MTPEQEQAERECDACGGGRIGSSYQHYPGCDVPWEERLAAVRAESEARVRELEADNDALMDQCDKYWKRIAELEQDIHVLAQKLLSAGMRLP